MKVNEKVSPYISSFQTDLKKWPYPTHAILKLYTGSYNVSRM